jgi:hypothetical protein
VTPAAVYRLLNARTGATLLVIPVIPGMISERAVRQDAGRQARRHGACGTWVLVTGGDQPRLYAEGRWYVRCAACGTWIEPRDPRTTPRCDACRAAARTGLEAAAAGAPARRRRKRRTDAIEQLILPGVIDPPAG